MNEDDPVRELHKIREAIWREAGGTAAAYARYYFEIGQKRHAASQAAQKDKKDPEKPKTKTPARRSGKLQRKAVAP